MKNQINQLQILENELVRYKEQKASLEQSVYPTDQEGSKQLLLNFYSEKITELQACVELEKAKSLEVEAEIIQANRTCCTGS